MRLCLRCWSSEKGVKAIPILDGATKLTLRTLFPRAKMSEEHANLLATSVLSGFNRHIYGVYDPENMTAPTSIPFIKAEYEELREVMTHGTSEQKQKYIAGRIKHIEEVRKHKALWDCYVRRCRAAEIQRIRDDQARRRDLRNKSLEQKLCELQLEYIVDMLEPHTTGHRFRKLIKMDCVAKLTNKEWQKLEPEAISFLRAVAAEKLPRRLKGIRTVVGCIARHKSRRPSLLDIIVRCKPINELLLKNTADYKKKPLSEHCRVILEFIDDWKRSYKDRLEELVQQELKPINLINPTRLAVGSIFACTYCGHVTPFQHIQAHACPQKPRVPIHEQYELKTPGQKILAEACLDFMLEAKMPLVDWMPEHFVSLASRLMPIVSEHCLDPQTATVKDMDESDIRLQCGPCKLLTESEDTMNWYEAITHAHEIHPDPEAKLCWIRIEDRAAWNSGDDLRLKTSGAKPEHDVDTIEDLSGDDPRIDETPLSQLELGDLLHEDAWM